MLTHASVETHLNANGLIHREVAMFTVDIHEAKRRLSRLIDRAAQGEPFVIAKAGKPLVKVSALDAPPAA